MNSTLAAATRALDPNHPITVGMGDYRNFWHVAAPGLPRVLDLVDFVSFHAYDATDFPGQARAIRGQTDKPILIEETGWPTGPAFQNHGYTEEVQRFVYQEAIAVAERERLAGIVPWLLWDLMPGRQVRATTEVDWMGLFRRDGSLKPAGEVFAAWRPPAMPPPVTTSDLPLTGELIPEAERPLYFPETGHTLAGDFKRRWLAAGGLPVIGLPLTEPFVHEDRHIQIFERAIMEWAPEVASEPGYERLTPEERTRRRAPLALLGRALTAGRQFALSPPFASEPDRWRFPETGHSLAHGFLTYWLTHGGLDVFGYPISEEIEEVSPTDGVRRVVQYFERARFEYHPDLAGTPYETQLGHLGREEMRRRGWLP